MEYVDGEGTASSRAAIEAHLATCAACQALVADQQRLAGTMHAWSVASSPASLQPPQPRATRVWSWRPTRTLAAGVAAAAVVLVAIAVQQRPRFAAESKAETIALGGRATFASTPQRALAPGSRATGAVGDISQDRAGAAESVVPQAGPRTPSVIRTATLQIVAKDFSTVRESVETIVTSAAGFLDRLTVTGDGTRARVLRGSLRIPGDQLNAVLAKLRPLGQVLEDTQAAQDVTDQLVDLDARLASARATERRLIDLLQNRTGRLSDVLEVEREVTRVRLDIERLDAEKANMTRRVAYATVDLTISEERKETIAGPLSLTTRLKVAALDGVEAALDTVAAITLFVLRAGPSLLLWGAVLGSAWMVFGRRFRDSRKSTASE